ncbi:hypothetical protein PAMC26577_01155 [Caballeronia sordidicola]|uniref:Uncharacterized protein n=1 Tax=Caballeronia sordidicola TaxID=196367 RepID=A0A242N7W7_CABSO|nr:hypothetical protein PAMC26577_01155 [Caballeronia sordidicola]
MHKLELHNLYEVGQLLLNSPDPLPLFRLLNFYITHALE